MSGCVEIWTGGSAGSLGGRHMPCSLADCLRRRHKNLREGRWPEVDVSGEGRYPGWKAEVTAGEWVVLIEVRSTCGQVSSLGGRYMCHGEGRYSWWRVYVSWGREVLLVEGKSACGTAGSLGGRQNYVWKGRLSVWKAELGTCGRVGL